MQLRICDSSTDAAVAAAALVVEQLRKKPSSVLGLPTGQTALGIYDALVAKESLQIAPSTRGTR